MKNLKNEFKREFDQLDLSEENSKNIKDVIVKKYNHRKRTNKIILSIFTVLFVTITSVGISYADEIKESINSLITKRTEIKTSQGKDITRYEIKADTIKELNYDSALEVLKCESTIAQSDDKCFNNYSYDELEKELGIKLLKSDLFVNNQIILKRLDRVDGKISSIELQMKNVMKKKKTDSSSSVQTNLNISIFISTKYHENTTENNDPSKFWVWNIDSEEEIHDYYIKKFNTTAKGTNFGNYGRFVVLLQDGIVYRFEMISVANKSVNPDEEMQRILDSLYY